MEEGPRRALRHPQSARSIGKIPQPEVRPADKGTMDQTFYEDPLDPDTLLQLRAIGDDGFIAELAEMYLADFEPVFAVLIESIRTDDRATAAVKAHFLKGSSLSMGLLALSGVLADIEHHFRDGSALFDEATMRELHWRADQARSRLHRFLAETEESATTGR